MAPRRNLLRGIALAACLFAATGVAQAADTKTGDPVGAQTAPGRVAQAGGTAATPAAPAATEPSTPQAQPATTNPGVPPSVDPVKVAAGREVFNSTCAHCHGPDAVAADRKINLRLLQHRYGEKMDEVFHFTVTHGRLDKGMPNWTGVFTEEDFANILAFLHTVQTTD